MSEGTTKPNGSREMNVEETEDVQKRIEDAGYAFTANVVEVRFSETKIQEGSNNASGGNSAKSSKAGNHTVVPNKATIAFKPLIPFIATGSKAKLKEGRKKDGKNTKTNIQDQDRV